MPYITTLTTAAPEILLAIFGVLGLAVGSLYGQRAPLFNASVLVLLAAAVLSALQTGDVTARAFGGVYVVHTYIACSKSIAFGMAAAALWVSRPELLRKPFDRFEYPLLIVFACLGIGIMLSADDLLVLYMGMETLALSSYVLAAFHPGNSRASEAGLKYFILGSVASGFFLFGVSIVYGFAGGMRLATIASAESSSGLSLGLIFVLAGLSFKIAAAPFHVWIPDVYEGAPLPSVTFFATAPKFAALILLARLLFEVFTPVMPLWPEIIAGLAALSMMVGALGALQQNDLKRLLAYSSVANVGFALICVAAGAKSGAGAALVYMFLYAIAALGMFCAMQMIGNRDAESCTIKDMNGLVYTRPGLAVLLAILIFSMAGLPPMAGFFGKWMAFSAGLEAGLTWLVVLGVVASVISLGYYLRLIWAIFMTESEAGALSPAPDSKGRWLVLSLSALALFPVLVIWIGSLSGLAEAVGARAF